MLVLARRAGRARSGGAARARDVYRGVRRTPPDRPVVLLRGAGLARRLPEFEQRLRCSREAAAHRVAVSRQHGSTFQAFDELGRARVERSRCAVTRQHLGSCEKEQISKGLNDGKNKGCPRRRRAGGGLLRRLGLGARGQPDFARRRRRAAGDKCRGGAGSTTPRRYVVRGSV